MTQPTAYVYEPEDRACIDEVVLSRSDGAGPLRSFWADIRLYDGDTTDKVMGHVRGLVGWQASEESMCEAGDVVSAEAEVLGLAADQISEWLLDVHGVEITNVVMVEMMRLDPEFRGHRWTSTILAELIEVLAVNPLTTLIVLQPEPQKESGGFMPDGPERDEAMARLRGSHDECGRQQWDESPVWWQVADSLVPAEG